MKFVKVAVEDAVEFTSKDGKEMYAVKVKGNRGRGSDGEYLKDISWFCDKATYDKFKDVDENGNVKGVILQFVGTTSVRG